jgi:transcriptional antiterminator NusG
METINQVSDPAEQIPAVPAKETKWYVLRVVSGKERKVKEYLDKEISRGGWSEVVKKILLHIEKVYKMQNVKKEISERNYNTVYEWCW